MNKIFHARISWNQVVFMIIAAALAFWAFWIKQALLAIIFLLMLVVLIERVIHTTYTLTTDGQLVLYYGRFSKAKEIAVSSIKHTEKFGNLMARGVVIHYENDRYVAVQPVDEEGFLKAIDKAREEIHNG